MQHASTCALARFLFRDAINNKTCNTTSIFVHGFLIGTQDLSVLFAGALLGVQISSAKPFVSRDSLWRPWASTAHMIDPLQSVVLFSARWTDSKGGRQPSSVREELRMTGLGNKSAHNYTHKPLQTPPLDARPGLSIAPSSCHVVVNQLRCHADDVLALPVFYQVDCLQRRYNVLRRYAVGKHERESIVMTRTEAIRVARTGNRACF